MADGSETTKDAQAYAKATAEQAAQAFAMNMQMGKAFMDAWSGALDQYRRGAQPTNGNAAPWMATNPWAAFMQPPAREQPADAPAFANVTRIWMEAVNEAMQRTQDAMRRGHALTPDALMDVWSKAASELSQAVVSDAAFASLTGQWVNAVSKAKTEAKSATTNQLRDLGFATHDDVEEVGKRLIELERRVHDLTIALEDSGDNASGSKKKTAKKSA